MSAPAPATGFERYVFAPERTKDKRPHDEIGTIGRAKATLSRARTAKSPPEWFEGTLEEYRATVESAIFAEYEGVGGDPPVAADAAGGDYFVTAQSPAFESAGGKNRYRKDILSVGKLVHPGTGDVHDFTPERLKALAANTNSIVAKGREVYFPEGHTRDARKNLGGWRDFEYEAGKLYATCTVRDPEARKGIDNKTLNRVSAFIKGPWTESDGSTYAEVIEHVAATPVPVNITQDDFEPVALSLSAEGFSVYVEDRPVADPVKPKTDVKLEASPEFLQALGLAADATPEQVILAAKEMKANATKATSIEAKQTALAAENADLSKRLATIEGEKLDQEIKLAVETGRINQKQAPFFRAMLAQKTSIALSVDGKPEEKPIADAVRQVLSLATIDKGVALEKAVRLPDVTNEEKAATIENERNWAKAYEQRTGKSAIWLDASGKVVPSTSLEAVSWSPQPLTAENGSMKT